MRKVGWVGLWLFMGVPVSLVMGLPFYGLIGTLRTGEDPLAENVGWGETLLIMGYGAVATVVLCALCWLVYRRWIDRD